MKLHKKIGIISCEDAPGWGGEQGLCQYIERRFKDIDGEEDTEYVYYYAVSGVLPTKQDVNGFDGFVISGSHYSVNAEHEWISNLIAFVKALRELKNGPKLFGICFGHQLIAKALGGIVTNNTSGEFFWGTEKIEIEESSQISDQLMRAFGESRVYFKIMQSHGEWVATLPKEAVCIGRSVTCDHEVLVYGNEIMSTQGHPELNTVSMKENILPRLRKKKILSKDEETLALTNLTDEDQKGLMQLVKTFLLSK